MHGKGEMPYKITLYNVMFNSCLKFVSCISLPLLLAKNMNFCLYKIQKA